MTRIRSFTVLSIPDKGCLRITSQSQLNIALITFEHVDNACIAQKNIAFHMEHTLVD